MTATQHRLLMMAGAILTAAGAVLIVADPEMWPAWVVLTGR